MTAVVIDASAAIALSSRATFNAPLEYFAPELIDLEYVSANRGMVMRGARSSDDAAQAIIAWADNDVTRCSSTHLIERIWQLRHNITAYDAAYVALAEHLGVALLTADRRLATAAAEYCEVVLVD